MGEDLKQLARRRVLVKKEKGGARRKAGFCFPRWISMRWMSRCSLVFRLRRAASLPASLPAPSSSLTCSATLFALQTNELETKNTKTGGHPRRRLALALPATVGFRARRPRLGPRRRGGGGRRLRGPVLRPGPRRGDDADRLGRDERLRGARLRRGA